MYQNTRKYARARKCTLAVSAVKLLQEEFYVDQFSVGRVTEQIDQSTKPLEAPRRAAVVLNTSGPKRIVRFSGLM